jgi:hypothetical protein
MRNRIWAASLAAAGLALAAAPVLADAPQTVVPTYNAIDAETLMKIINAQGKVQITPDGTDPQGPILKVQLAGGAVYTVLMDDCDSGAPSMCKDLEFRATLPPGSLNFAQINSFNQNMRYATAYLGDKGVPQLRMDENLRGGVTAQFIAYGVQIFVKVLSNYVGQAQ